MCPSFLQHINTDGIDLKQLPLSASSSFSLRSCGSTHKGHIRFVNEDAYLELPEQRLWAVADGMGGHQRGDYASQSIVRALKSFSRHGNMKLDDIIRDLQNRLVVANSDCRSAFRAKRVGSTIVLFFEYGDYGFFLWAGDSRVYRLRSGKLEQLTHDHSLAQEKYDDGELKLEELASHPSAHILTKAVGIHRHLQLQLTCAPISMGDRYLLCSDGLYSGVILEEIGTYLSTEVPSDALQALIQLALDKGGRDNITGVIIDSI